MPPEPQRNLRRTEMLDAARQDGHGLNAKLTAAGRQLAKRDAQRTAHQSGGRWTWAAGVLVRATATEARHA